MADPVTLAVGAGTAAAGLMGANKQKKAIARARREQAEAARAAQARYEPYRAQGEYATQQIREGLDTGTLGGSFTPGDLTQEPGYQFRLEQGEQAQDRLQAARGNLYSGQAIKERERFAQGLADQTYQDAYNRWLREQQQRYGVLSGQQQLGYGAAGGVADIDVAEGQRAAEATMARRAAQDRGVSTALGAGGDILGGMRGPESLYESTGGIPPGGFGSSLRPASFVGY